MICSKQDCNKKSVGQKLCSKHYQRAKSSGEITTKPRLKHGKHGTPEYKIWDSMLQRCNNPKNRYYYNYGGRGITVSDSWKNFTQFYNDMGDRPSELYSIERYDNEEGYSKDNCGWETRTVQQHNRRTWSKSGTKGVYINNCGNFVVEISKDRVRHYIGTYKNLIEARKAYIRASEKYYGY